MFGAVWILLNLYISCKVYVQHLTKQLELLGHISFMITFGFITPELCVNMLSLSIGANDLKGFDLKMSLTVFSP